MDRHAVRPIGWVHSPLRRRADAPKQGHEGAPNARLQIEPAFLPGLDGIRAGQDILILTWLHEAQRDVLAVHPRDDQAQPLTGVFSTRSPDRPNPIGLHRHQARSGPGWRLLRCGLPSKSGHGLQLQSPSYTGEVVITVPDGVILEHELARERGIGVERDRGRLIELPVAQSPDGGRGRRAVAPEQIQRRLFGDGVVFLGVLLGGQGLDAPWLRRLDRERVRALEADNTQQV